MDDRTQETTTTHSGVLRVDEREVRLAMDRLDLADRNLNVYRATAFLTALGVTVSHEEEPLGPTTMDDDEPVTTAGDVANLIEVRGWLRNRAPLVSVDQFRARRRVPSRHRGLTA